ncbi:MAG: hypothetical protein QOJ15_2198 [Bradyrhizobium sp.]|nr:hypothetical protein [Bradyrhizobium sp.]
MEDSTLNHVRDSPGGVVHELPPLSTSDWLHLSCFSFNGSRLACLEAAKYLHRDNMHRTADLGLVSEGEDLKPTAPSSRRITEFGRRWGSADIVRSGTPTHDAAVG